MNEKLGELIFNLGVLDSLAVAYSGGVDSSFLLKIAHELKGSRLLAVIVNSATMPRRELQEAIDYVNALKINYHVIETDHLAIEGFAENPENRCYLCKQDLFAKIWSVARENGISWVADGTNCDDANDFRPGMAVLDEFGVISPLKQAGLGKEEIRHLSQRMQLKTWDKPSEACLASRFAYGQRISLEKLKSVELAEDYLLELGFRQVRVRVHDDLARIEVNPEERSNFFNEKILDQIKERFNELGFRYSSLDLGGYRNGSMNEPIKADSISDVD